IRYRNVTGVQTCALPICPFTCVPDERERAELTARVRVELLRARDGEILAQPFDVPEVQLRTEVVPEPVYLEQAHLDVPGRGEDRSEERRVGKECRAWCES